MDPIGTMKGHAEVSKIKYYLMISSGVNTVDVRSLTHGVYLENGWNRDVTISLRMFQRKSTTQWPCTQDASRTNSRCTSRCFHQAFIEQSGCRMPYMDSLQEEEVGYCSAAEQLRAAEVLQHGMLNRGIGWNPSSCSCQTTTACSHQLFEWFTDTFSNGRNYASYRVRYTYLEDLAIFHNRWRC